MALRRRRAEADGPKRVLVTGASGGLGRAIALALARAGFPIVAHFGRNVDAAEEVAHACRDAGVSAATLGFDVADRAAAREALTGEIEANGAFWGVVCNAGIHDDAAFPAMAGESWDRVLSTNLDAFHHVVQPLVLPMVRARAGGRIVTISSISGQIGNRGQVNYAASKAGLIGASRALSLELAARQITVNSVAPGLIESEMAETAPMEAIRTLIPMQRLGSAEEVAAVVAFLFSEGAAYVTGQTISVNGGLA
ncbi:MAG: 3-oxoacyl-ACP reductase FabG [bacterium]|nr:3-oxoacyl-ACP reductase FabG [bacterium]MCP5069897.1 3-oxoacyl-ACP reductase FabG [bacterium]